MNELVQKVSGSDQPVPLWEEGEVEKHTTQDLLYSFSFRFKVRDSTFVLSLLVQYLTRLKINHIVYMISFIH